MPYQKGEGKSVVIALGGNALGNTPQEQLQLVKDTAKNIVDMVDHYAARPANPIPIILL